MSKDKNKDPNDKSVFEDLGRDLGEEVRRNFDYVAKGEIRKDAADFIRNHGQDRLKTGFTSAAKVGAVTWKVPPLAKVAIPAAFVAGVLGGPAVSRRIAEWVDGRKNGASETDAPKPKDPTGPL
jgi:hypothetical protein